ncbi:N-acyl-D-amino-acid deacylase family protein [Paenibacillus beijingensis]|uniref:Amidohydrolase 3 domain-containing protein n=1 Tax=Paenibacillus beijingensis TaxID=1126833 RepID=A0A0D5NJJ0_9BACL|nr:D-aminoacylase [Paenibacillus beijingensis]AJY75103.1 hypothetical protein VN24_11605 [Paenibacillus beijingensis]
MKADLWIKNGLIVDGSGAERRQGGVAVSDGKLIMTGEGAARDEDIDSDAIIDAEGLIVAPGFIDIHTHSDLTLLIDSRGASKISQGVTTEIVGNCGMSAVDCCGTHKDEIREGASFLYADLIPWTWNNYADYLAEFDKRGISMNVGCFIGHGTVRASVMGYENRQPAPEEMDAMKQFVAEAMEAGALGLSSGLIYSPGIFAQSGELIELCKVVARYGGVYTTHMRNESTGLLDSVEEALYVAREARVSLEISHLKVTGTRNWGMVAQAVKRIRAAREEGIDVHYDFYPYHASSTGMTYMLPPWVQAGGWEASRKRILDPVMKERMIAEIENGTPTWISPALNAGWDRIRIASVQTEASRRAEGLSLKQYAELCGQPPVEAMLQLLLAEEGGVGMVLFVMSEEDIEAAASSELSIVASDGFAIAADGVLSRSKPHPRSYGSFTRVFDRYCRQRPVMTLEQAVHKMTGLPASKLSLHDRGLLRDGFAADVVLFHPEHVKDAATFEQPHRYSKGVHTVLVNGRIAYSEGTFHNPKSGMVVKMTPSGKEAAR